VKRALIAAGVLLLLVSSVFVARWLNNDSNERSQVTELLRAQARGDAEAMLAILRCPDEQCIALARANARKLRAAGELKIALYQSQTAHAVRPDTEPTRVVWFTPGRLTTVQCVLVRRSGNPFAGMSISLLRLSAPIDRESSCP
jgi:ketosteroid isomerase-like protein